MSEPAEAETGRVWQLPNEAALRQLALDFGRSLRAPLVIYLQGGLGAGKTTFARALIQGLGYSGRVKSPTYGLLESYQTGGFDFLHLDLYRIESPAELEYLAISDQFSANGVLLIEWPEKALETLPAADIRMIFKESGEVRSVEFEGNSEMGSKVIGSLKSA